jgi:hypothetical protein
MSDEPTKKSKVNYGYPDNSDSAKEPEESDRVKLEPIVKTAVTRHKQTAWDKVKETMFGASAREVGHDVLTDVIVPAIKDLIVTSGNAALESIFWGRTGQGPRGGHNRRQHVSYDKVTKKTPFESERKMSQKARASHNFDEIVFDTRGEAEEVRDALTDYAERFDVAPISALYDLVGITGSFQDDKWGWYELRGANVTRARVGGYLLNLPRPEPID